jgi:hypothetical protein
MNTELLFSLLQMKRPHGTEYQVADLILPSAPYAHVIHHVKATELMCIQVDTCVNPTTMFTCHLDTVETERGYKQIEVSADNLVTTSGGGVLGADDAAGIALLVHMIENGVKGRFMFFAGEERGGIGSRYMVQNHKELFTGINRAIAFDRKGCSDVIVSQTGEQGCSNEFGTALSLALTTHTHYQFEPTTGIYTDTAEMFDLVPECTNVSVGYYNEHTKYESLDLTYLFELAEAVCKIDFDSLPTVRNPALTTGYGDYHGLTDYDDDISAILDQMQINGVTIGDLIAAIKEEKLYELL